MHSSHVSDLDERLSYLAFLVLLDDLQERTLYRHRYSVGVLGLVFLHPYTNDLHIYGGFVQGKLYL